MPSPIEVVLVPALMILIGFILKEKSFLKQSDREILSDIVLYIALPSMIFINLHNARISHDMLLLPIAGLVLSFLLLIIAYLYCRIRKYSKKTTWTIMIAASLMNTGFIGFPVAFGVYGSEGFLNAIFFDLSTSLLIIAYGIILSGKTGKSKKETVKKSLSFIPIWAVVFALIFNALGISLPYVADTILDYFAQATIPLIMICVGLSLDFKNIKDNLTDSIAVSFIKLIMSPLIISILLSLANIKGMAFNVGVLEAGMSTAMSALVLSIAYDLDSNLMGSVIFSDVVLSVFSLTAIITLLGC